MSPNERCALPKISTSETKTIAPAAKEGQPPGREPSGFCWLVRNMTTLPMAVARPAARVTPKATKNRRIEHEFPLLQIIRNCKIEKNPTASRLAPSIFYALRKALTVQFDTLIGCIYNQERTMSAALDLMSFQPGHCGAPETPITKVCRMSSARPANSALRSRKPEASSRRRKPRSNQQAERIHALVRQRSRWRRPISRSQAPCNGLAPNRSGSAARFQALFRRSRSGSTRRAAACAVLRFRRR